MKNQKGIKYNLDKNRIECPDDVMVKIYREKSPVERVRIASGMWESAWRQIKAVLRSQHPDWSDNKIHQETIKRLSHENL